MQEDSELCAKYTGLLTQVHKISRNYFSFTFRTFDIPEVSQLLNEHNSYAPVLLTVQCILQSSSLTMNMGYRCLCHFIFFWRQNDSIFPQRTVQPILSRLPRNNNHTLEFPIQNNVKYSTYVSFLFFLLFFQYKPERTVKRRTQLFKPLKSTKHNKQMQTNDNELGEGII